MGLDTDDKGITPLKAITPDTDFLSGQLFLVDKPLHWTSFDVVNKVRYAVRRRLGIKKVKVGHAGTLDPLATGLLLLAVGRMTKRLQELQDLPKEYQGTMCFGASTPTYDSEMSPNEIFDLETLSKEIILKHLPAFKGDIYQIPPVFSAVKKDGKSAYKYARKGQEVQLNPRKVHIYKFDIMEKQWPEFDFNVRCSKGTYIRSLAHDLGKACGNGAYLTRLVRTHIGTYSLEEAWQLEDLIDALNPEQ